MILVIANASSMRCIKYQKGFNIFQLALFLLALAVPSFIVQYSQTKNPLVYVLGFIWILIVFLVPLVFSIWRRVRGRKDEGNRDL